MNDCLSKLSKPPITTQARIKVNSNMSYPALTFCYKNNDGQGYDLETLQVRQR